MVLSILNELTADPFPSQLQKSTSYSSCQNNPALASYTDSKRDEDAWVRMHCFDKKSSVFMVLSMIF